MKFLSVTLCLVVLTLGLAGCKKPSTDASGPLAHSFENADAETKQNIQSINSNLKTSNYVDAVKILLPLVERQKLNPDQKEAVSLTLKQINEAVAANDSLNSPEMYELLNKLFHAVYKN